MKLGSKPVSNVDNFVGSRSRPRSGYSVGSSLGSSVYASTILSMEEKAFEDAESEDFLTGPNGLNDQQWILQVGTRTIQDIPIETSLRLSLIQ